MSSTIENLLIENNVEKIKYYFPQDSYEKWISKYKESMKNISHDEPWLTLVSMYALFGELKSNIDCEKDENDKNSINIINDNSLYAFKKLLENANIDTIVKEINCVKLEKILPEIISYRNKLKNLYKKENFHLYPDIKEIINQKIEKYSSFEGNTNLDLFIKGKNTQGDKVVFFIESKFLSDIDTKTKYNFSRDQIIRNIDAGIEYCQTNKINLENFHFLLLTPKIFKTAEFGGNKASVANEFNPTKSRLYAYKMKEYTNEDYLKRVLPHRIHQISEYNWQTIAMNISWITFDDIFDLSNIYDTIKADEKELIKKFFEERHLI